MVQDRRWLVGLGGLLVLVSVSAALAQDVPAARPADGALGQPDAIGGYSTSQILVRFADGALPVREGAAVRDDTPTLSSVLWDELDGWGVAAMRPVFSGKLRGTRAASSRGADRVFILQVPAGTDTPAMVEALNARGGEIESASLEILGGIAAVPNDPFFDIQYGMHNTGGPGAVEDADIDAPEAWDIHTGNPGTVTVAIIDSGVDPHPEFVDRMVPGINTHLSYPPDHTGDGKIHGTHVAGIVAAAGDNGAGVAGRDMGRATHAGASAQRYWSWSPQRRRCRD